TQSRTGCSRNRSDRDLHGRERVGNFKPMVGSGPRVPTETRGDIAQWAATISVGEDSPGHTAIVYGRGAARIYGVRQHQLSASDWARQHMGPGSGEAGIHRS